MQRDAINLEKEVAAKNNKIYELEMNYLKGSRGVTGQRTGGTTVGINAYGERPSRYTPINKTQTRAERTNKNDRNQQPSPRNAILAYPSLHSAIS